jgi:transposase
MEALEAGGGMQVPSPAIPQREETPVLKIQVVEEIVARLARGASVSELAAEYGVDRKTVRAWRARGGWRPRAPRARASILDAHATWLTARAPEVEYNAAVLYRELKERGYAGSAQQVLRFVRPLRVAARTPAATSRYETAPGQQAQVDFGQRRIWVGETPVVAHLFVFTLGFSRRLYTEAFRHERLDAVLTGHEHAFRHFAGVPEQIVVDNARPVVLRHERVGDRHSVVWHPTYADFASYYGFRPWAHWPYRPQTKGKTESGVKYVQRNALAGKRFPSWEHVNPWLVEWCTTVADLRVHGTTHEVPRERFARAEQDALSPLGARRVYARERVRHRVVASDALVAIGASRYSVPVRYVGATVTIRELLGSYEILHAGTVIARHTRADRHQVVMERGHYAGLLRPGRATPLRPPQHDPRFADGLASPDADVAVRDLAVYEAIAEATDHGERAGGTP